MNQDTLNKMKQLRLFGMYDAFKTSLESSERETLTQDQFIALLVSNEWDDRKNRNIDRSLKLANFRYKASMEQIDYDIERGLDKNQLYRLANLDFVKEHKDLFIIGSTGTGKSYLATALGYQACQMGYRVLYTSTAKLMGQLKLAKAKGTILAELKKIERQDLLILDDFGIQPFDSQARTSLLDIIEDRHQKRSVIITSQIPVKEWYEVIGEKTIADAILDRIVHHALRIELFGESLRRKSFIKENQFENIIFSPKN
jgi:DNA replication protein DnaC